MLPERFAKEFLEIERKGSKLYEQFIEERIVGSKPISKRKQRKPNQKVVTVKIQNQLLNIKVERKLTSRFTVQD